MNNNSKKKSWQQPNENTSSSSGKYLALYLSFFLGPFGLGVIAPVFSGLILRNDFYSLLGGLTWHIRSVLLGVLIAAFPLFQYIGSSIYILFSSRISRKKLLLTSALAQGLGWLGGICALYNDSYIVMLITRCWTGIFAGSYILTLIPDHGHLENPKRVKQYHKVLSVLAATGFIVGVCVGGILSDHSLTYAFSNVLAFGIAAGLCFFVFFILFFFFPKEEGECGTCHPYKSFSWKNLYKKKRMRRFVPFLFLYFVFFLGYFPFLQFYPYFIHVTHEGTKLYISIMLISIGVGYFFGLTWLWKQFSHLSTRKTVSSLTFLALTVCAIFIASVNDLTAISIFHIALAICAGLSVKVIATYLMSKKAILHADLISYHEATALVAASISPILAGLVLLISIYSIYYLIASFFFVGLLCSFFIKDDN